jgi:hypothetical protein
MESRDSHDLNLENPDCEKVLEWEGQRKTKGYKAGWLYHRCKTAGLLEVLESLRNQGLVEDVSRSTMSVEPEPAGLPRQQLTIELVPQTCWYSNVRSEVSSSDWDTLKKITFEKAGNRCEICNGKGRKWPVECHEIWHYDDMNLVQTLRGLIALCPACHEVKHMGYANTQGRGDIAARHLSKVNGWSEQATKQYIHDQFQVWLKRSKYEWRLDISWLDQFELNSNSPGNKK